MSQSQNPHDSEAQPASQQQALGDVQIQGDDNIFNVIQAEVVTLTQTKIIQISVDEIKTRELITTSPYKGLKKFEPEDRDRFFGRDQFLVGLVNDLEHTNFILLLGASGSGKSSIIRAGLIPWLQQKWGKHFVSLMFTPDRDPFESLYGSLLSRGYSQSQAQIAKAGKAETLSQVVKTLKPPETFWLIFIDQFEELFTVSEDDKCDGAGAPTKSERFIDGLIKLSQMSPTPVKIVATMRADFLDRLSPYPKLVKVTDRHRPLIAEMQMDELRLAIEQPAAHHGVVFETGLVEEIISAVQGQAGCLPLLQYTLDLLWESEVQDGGIGDRTLNITSYRRLGGVRGALQQRVDQIYEALSEPEQLAAQRIFLKLVEIGGDAESGTEWKPVRRRAARSEFTGEQEQTVLTQLIDQNLLVSDAIVQATGVAPVPTVEIAHEILLTSWSRLHDWIESNRQAIALRNRLSHDVMLWQAKKADSDLWSGSKLAQVVELQKDLAFQQVLGGFSAPANQFIDASVGLRDRQRRRALLGLSGFSLVALALAAFAGYQWREADLGQIRALSQSSVAKFSLNRYSLDGLTDALKAGKLLEQSPWLLYRDPKLQADVMTALTQTVFWTQEQNRLQGDSQWVSSLSFSPDSQTIASSNGGNTVILWKRDGSQLAVLKGHTAGVISVSFNPVDGETLVSGGLDKTVRLWRRDGTLLKTFDGHGIVMSAGFSPDGQLIAASGDDHKVRLWQVDGTPVAVLAGHKGRIDSTCFSPDGQTIASASHDGTVKLWQRNGRLIQTLQGPQKASSVSFSPDGQLIAATGGDDTVKIWRRDGTLMTTFKAHSDGVIAIRFSPDSKILASAGQDNTVKLWDRNGTLLTTLPGHTNWVTNVGFSPDGSLLASSSNDGSIKLWQSHNPLLTVFSNDRYAVNSISFSPDGELLVAASMDNTVKLWRRNGALLKTLRGHRDRVNRVSFSPDGQLFASASEDGQVKLWRRDGSLFLTLKSQNKFSDASFSPNGQTIVTADRVGKIQLWQRDGKLFKTLYAHKGYTYSVKFSADGQMIASAGADGIIRLWKADGTPIRNLKESQEKVGTIYRVSFSSDNQRIAATSTDGMVKLWMVDGKSVITLKGKGSPMNTVSFNPVSQVIAAADEQGTIFLWQPDGTLITELNGHRKGILGLSFSSDGKTLVSAGDDAQVMLWNLENLNLNYFLNLGCNKVHNFLTTNPDIDQSNKQLCLSS